MNEIPVEKFNPAGPTPDEVKVIPIKSDRREDIDVPKMVDGVDDMTSSLFPMFQKMVPSIKHEHVRDFVQSFCEQMDALLKPKLEEELDEAYNIGVGHCIEVLEKCGNNPIKAYKVMQKMLRKP